MDGAAAVTIRVDDALRVYAALVGAIEHTSALPAGLIAELEDARWLIVAAVHGIEGGS